MRGEILWLERRRIWRDEDKLEIVVSVGIDGATVTQVAQRHEVARQQIYAWRHDLKKKGLWSPDAGALFFYMDMPSSTRLNLVANLACYAACWAHLRRDFHDFWSSTKSEIAREALDRIGKFDDIERFINGQPADIR